VEPCRLDHLVIGAPTLEEGVAYVQEQFGVDIPKGGEHLSMATHNHLMQLGNNTFVELIAPAPALEANPERLVQPRWFGLDERWLQERLTQSPGLIAWVVNCDDLHATSYKSLVSVGAITRITRGDLAWLFALPGDGRLLAGGALPYFMQWETDEHPSLGMKDLGVRLQSLEIAHSQPDWLAARFEELGIGSLATVCSDSESARPRITATFNIPDPANAGESRAVTLSSPF